MSYEIEGAEAVSETDKGIWVEAADLSERTFIPQSQITDESEVWKKGDKGALIVTDWLAEQRGWL